MCVCVCVNETVNKVEVYKVISYFISSQISTYGVVQNAISFTYSYERVCLCFNWNRSRVEKAEEKRGIYSFFFSSFLCLPWAAREQRQHHRWQCDDDETESDMRSQNSHRHTQAIFVFERIYFAFLAFPCCCFNRQILRRRTTRSVESYRVLRAWIVLLWERCSCASIITPIIVITYFPSFRVRCWKARVVLCPLYFWRKNR